MKSGWWFTTIAILVALRCNIATGVDFGETYPATLEHSKNPIGYNWKTGEKDVWRLKSFSFRFEDDLAISVGAAQVVFGRYEKNVLWAVVIPDEPGVIERASTGRGEHPRSIWLRFHPVRVAESVVFWTKSAFMR